METARLVLEYLKAILSPWVMAGAVLLVFLARFREDIRALLGRVAFIKLPGGAELSIPQLQRATDAMLGESATSVLPAASAVPLPEGLHLTQEQAKAITEAFKAERAKAYLWEYRYLNYFLAPNTQRVLEWLDLLPERTTRSTYDAWWLPVIPSAEERSVILSALETHHLLVFNGDLIEVTAKGHEYLDWRKALFRAAV
ncbi:MAG: hypothetical protein HYR55_15905 [Acidobacteria bacterium]|nr:hypothetical protein [Acidobacteriota bacterium]MBI3656796.1 hypothetical protein [Acidobacteriota bacterium]